MAADVFNVPRSRRLAPEGQSAYLQEQILTAQSYACTGHKVRGSETDGRESMSRWTPFLDK